MVEVLAFGRLSMAMLATAFLERARRRYRVTTRKVAVASGRLVESNTEVRTSRRRPPREPEGTHELPTNDFDAYDVGTD